VLGQLSAGGVLCPPSSRLVGRNFRHRVNKSSVTGNASRCRAYAVGRGDAPRVRVRRGRSPCSRNTPSQRRPNNAPVLRAWMFFQETDPPSLFGPASRASLAGQSRWKNRRGSEGRYPSLTFAVRPDTSRSDFPFPSGRGPGGGRFLHSTATSAPGRALNRDPIPTAPEPFANSTQLTAAVRGRVTAATPRMRRRSASPARSHARRLLVHVGCPRPKIVVVHRRHVVVNQRYL